MCFVLFLIFVFNFSLLQLIMFESEEVRQSAAFALIHLCHHHHRNGKLNNNSSSSSNNTRPSGLILPSLPNPLLQESHQQESNLGLEKSNPSSLEKQINPVLLQSTHGEEGASIIQPEVLLYIYRHLRYVHAPVSGTHCVYLSFSIVLSFLFFIFFFWSISLRYI